MPFLAAWSADIVRLRAWSFFGEFYGENLSIKVLAIYFVDCISGFISFFEYLDGV